MAPWEFKKLSGNYLKCNIYIHKLPQPQDYLLEDTK